MVTQGGGGGGEGVARVVLNFCTIFYFWPRIVHLLYRFVAEEIVGNCSKATCGGGCQS